MNTSDSIELRMAGLRTAAPTPELRARVLRAARAEWQDATEARRASRITILRWTAGAAALLILGIGVSLREERLTARALTAARAVPETPATDAVAELFKDVGIKGAYARLRQATAPARTAAEAWAALRGRETM